jgi:protein phosphatase
VREHNEDSLLVKPPLYVIADGMGGHAAGEIASELAIHILEDAAIDGVDSQRLRDAVIEANNAIIEGAQKGLGRVGMGTTLTAAVIENDRLLIAQIGDSRAYLLQNGRLRQITRDHSLVEELISTGQITTEEARVHPNRSVITRALGSDQHVQPDLYEMQVGEGDRLLLCSDGLNSMLDTATLESIVTKSPDPQKTADALVDAANKAGGYDNITVIVIDVDRVAPQTHLRLKRHFLWGIIVFLIAFVLLVGGTIGGVYAYARNAVFLIEESGYVALYRGLPGDMMGFELKWREEVTNIPVNSLNPATVNELRSGMPMDSMDDAQRFIKQHQKQQ